jgi:L-rhamnonate dehydratase
VAHAEARGVRVIPHCWSADILIASTLAVVGSCATATYLEFNATDNPLRTGLAADPFRPVDGLVHLRDAPGLGIELNEDTIARYRVDAR